MAKTPKLYTRLTRPRSGLGTYSSLWRGPDHLLVVSSTGFNESYQRFYFRDIKGFVLTDSKRYFYYNVLSSVVLLFSVLPLLADLNGGESFAAALGNTLPMMMFTLPAFIILVVNLCKGPSCNIAIATGLQTPRFSPVGRKRAWRKLRAKIDAPIRETQAALIAEAANSTSQPRVITDPETPLSNP